MKYYYKLQEQKLLAPTFSEDRGKPLVSFIHNTQLEFLGSFGIQYFGIE